MLDSISLCSSATSVEQLVPMNIKTAKKRRNGAPREDSTLHTTRSMTSLAFLLLPPGTGQLFLDSSPPMVYKPGAVAKSK